VGSDDPMIELILLFRADQDIQTAFDRYEDHQTGRGEVFMRHLDAAFTILRQQPEIGSPYAGSYRRMLIREFPYGIFYEGQPKRLVVAAVMDLRQEPRSIRRKLFGPEENG
jgi:plasmid stabilization system protein ParE